MTIDTYAPRFDVRVRGARLDSNVTRDVLTVKVVLDTKEASSFSLTLNNSDTDAPVRARPRGGPRFPTRYTDTDLFDVGHEVHISMGYGRELMPMLQGRITGLAPSFPASGASTLAISGEDATSGMRDRRPSGTQPTRWPPDGADSGISDRELMTTLASSSGLRLDLLGGPELDAKYDQLVQDTDDLTFLLNRARRLGYDAFVRTDVDGRTALKVVDRARMVQSLGGHVFTLVWGESLVSFSPTLNASRQVGQVTARGWDREKKQPIEHTATADSLGLGDRSGPKAVAAISGEKHEVLVDFAIESQTEARTIADSALRARADQFVTGRASCVGNARMRPGDGVYLGGLGQRFDGLYVIEKVTHTISGSGFVSELSLRRPDDGGTAAATASAGGSAT